MKRNLLKKLAISASDPSVLGECAELLADLWQFGGEKVARQVFGCMFQQHAFDHLQELLQKLGTVKWAEGQVISIDLFLWCMAELVLCTDPDFAESAVDLLLEHFAPSEELFVGGSEGATANVRSYFLRQVHFLTLESIAEVRQLLGPLQQPGRAPPAGSMVANITLVSEAVADPSSATAGLPVGMRAVVRKGKKTIGGEDEVVMEPAFAEKSSSAQAFEIDLLTREKLDAEVVTDVSNIKWFPARHDAVLLVPHLGSGEYTSADAGSGQQHCGYYWAVVERSVRFHGRGSLELRTRRPLPLPEAGGTARGSWAVVGGPSLGSWWRLVSAVTELCCNPKVIHSLFTVHSPYTRLYIHRLYIHSPYAAIQRWRCRRCSADF
jgi:hypothetical protein